MQTTALRPALLVATTFAVTAALVAGGTGADAAPRTQKYKKGSAATIAKRGWGATTTPSPVTTPPVKPTTSDPLSNRAARLSDGQARALLAANGISVYSSGGCSNRNATNCTSLDTILTGVIADVITLKKKSKCTVLVTGGTETGHAVGPTSHWNGYKADINMNLCLSTWVSRNGKALGGDKWAVGNAVYWHEGNHFDVTSTP